MCEQSFTAFAWLAEGIIFLVSSLMETKRKIYIVEDDPDLQHLLQFSLARAGYHVTIFPTGYPVIAMTDQWPDIFIIDIELPGINGLEICRWLKHHDDSKNIPVLFLSAAPYLKNLAQNVGGNDYLEKPFDLAALISKINEFTRSEPISA
jgi:DNA-binding response OmpR family regulator